MNVGNCLLRYKHLYYTLIKDKLLDLEQTSVILKNPPFGYINQPYFYNTIMVLKTNLSPQKLLNYLQHIEYKFKRERLFKNSPRTLDLDIIFFDKIKINKNNLVLPHANWSNRVSVTLPLQYIME